MAKKTKRKPKQSIGERIRELREGAGLTQAEAAEKAGLSAGYWPQLEGGFRDPSLRALTKIASALGCEVADLLP